MSDQNGAPFSEARARAALDVACRAVALPPSDARLIRMGENALFKLDDAPVVVRIARSIDLLDDVRKEVAVADWLGTAGFPAVGLYGVGDQPLVALGCPVTFWRFEQATDLAPSLGDLGLLLRRLHELPHPDGLVLPSLDPFGRVAERLDVAHRVADDDIALLRSLHGDLQRDWSSLKLELSHGPVHGDAHSANLLRRTDGAVLILDFERFASGPREWDLVEAGLEHHVLGWVSADEYGAFVRSYGYDIAKSPAFHTLCRIRQLTMTTWLMQNVAHSPEIAREFGVRVHSLRTGTGFDAWRPH